MTRYLGDLKEGATVVFGWDSNDSDGASITRSTDGTIYAERVGAPSGTGATVTKANPGVVTATGHGLSNGDQVFFFGMSEMTELNQTISTVANKTTDTFEIQDTSGYGAAEVTGGSWVQVDSNAVTDDEDYKGATGCHRCKINTDGVDYYSAGADYLVFLNAATIDGQTVNALLAQFSIENRAPNSQLTVIDSRATLTESRATVIQSQTTVIASNVLVVDSRCTVIASDTTVIDSRVQALGPTDSRLTVIQSQTTLMESARPTLLSRSSSLVADFSEIRAALGIPSISFEGGVPVGGFLSRMLTFVRLETDEPATTAKYSNGMLVAYAENSYARIMGDITRTLEYPATTYFDVTIDSTEPKDYVIPHHVKMVLVVEVVDTNGNREQILYSRAHQNLAGTGFTLEGGLLRVGREQLALDTIVRIHYVPTGTARIHEGTCTLNDDGDEVTLDESPSLGALDTHVNAYAGMCFRIISATTNDYRQERLVKSYDHETRTLTLAAALSPVPSGTITYDIVPVGMLDDVLDQVVSLDVAHRVLSNEGNRVRAQTVLTRYQMLMREIRLTAANWSIFQGSIFKHDTAQNEDWDYQGY